MLLTSSSKDAFDDCPENDNATSPEAKLLNKATWFSSYTNLTSTIIGAGVLGLPYSFSKTGWIVGLILISLCAAMSALALHFLSLCIRKTKSPSSFYLVAEKALPSVVWLIDFTVAVKCFGVATSYLIVIGDLMPVAMMELYLPNQWLQRNTWVIIGFIFCAPLSCFSSLDALKWSSAISLVFLLFLAVVIVLYAFPDISGLDPCFGQISMCNGSKIFVGTDLDALKVISVFIFGYSCQQNIFSIVNELHIPTQARVNTIIAASVGSAWALYAVVASFGYLTYGDHVLSDVLKSYPVTPTITACRISMSLIVACHFPLQVHPARRSLLTLIQYCMGKGVGSPGLTKNESPSPLVYNFRFVTITMVFLLGSLYLALAVKDLGVVLAIVGATGSTLVSYILPGLCYVLLHRREGPVWKRWVAVAQCGLGLLIMPLCLMVVFL